MKILIAGTPGVGKTTLSTYLSSVYNIAHIDISPYIIEHKLYKSYSSEDDTFDFSAKVVRKHLKTKLNGDFIIDTHSPQIVKHFKFDYVFVIRLPISILTKRLEEREYRKEKVQCNVDCEVFNEVGFIAEKYFDSVRYIGSEDEDVDVQEQINDILRINKAQEIY